MKHVLCCLLLALPAGCASYNPQDNSPQAFCERQANNNPAVQKLVSQQLTEGGGSPLTAAQIRLAKRRAMQNCLLAKGIAVPGGVEPVLPR